MNAKKFVSWISVSSSAAFRVLTIMLLGLVLLATQRMAHARPNPGDKAPVAAEQSATGVRAFPRVALGSGRQLEYVGSFSASGKFKSLSRFGLFVDSMMTASLSGQPATPLPDAAKLNAQDATKQVPPSIELHRDEQLVEDFQPPEHAVKVAKGHSVVEELRDSIVSLAYGPGKVLLTPQSLTTDSRQRVIVTDAAAHGLHVLAYAAKDSFQIVGGPGRRLQSPSGVAVDSDDNIYVSDSERGVVLVYDSEGRFLRTIGNLGDEGMFARPTSIAIDTKAGHLYVIDQPRHMLLILDLEGKVLARVGTTDGTGFSSRAGSSEPGRLKDPQAVMVHNDEVIVLDSARIHILDLQGKFLKEFKVSNSAILPKAPTPGLFMDAANRIYVSDPVRGVVRMYTHEGQFLGAFGRPGVRMGEFNAPAGMWADSTGRIFIVDAGRVQVFQLSGAK
jgi:DNA-binding beta-propeller fold protein YncE